MLGHYTTAPDSPIEAFKIWWAMTGSNRRHPACKAGALPAELIALVGDPYGIRTRVTAVKGPCLRPLDQGAFLRTLIKPDKNGEPSATRTRDTLIKSQVLYQLS